MIQAKRIAFNRWDFLNNWPGMLGILLYGLLLGAIYYSTFCDMIPKIYRDDDYTYALLIPPLIIYLIWINRQRLYHRSSYLCHY